MYLRLLFLLSFMVIAMVLSLFMIFKKHIPSEELLDVLKYQDDPAVMLKVLKIQRMFRKKIQNTTRFIRRRLVHVLVFTV